MAELVESRDWKKLRQLRKYLKPMTPEKFSTLPAEEKDRVFEAREIERILTYRYDFEAFCKEVLGAESWGENPVKWGEVHTELCRFLRSCKNMGVSCLIQLPRGHLKTQICTIFYRIWRVVNDPELCSMIVSGTLELSKSTARSVRRELHENKRLQALYPHVLPEWIYNERRNKWAEVQFNVARHGNYPQCSIEAVGVEATVTGKHFGEITLDDLVTPENSTTAEQCEKVIQAYRYFISVIDPLCGRFVVVGTPYKDSDLYAYLKGFAGSKKFRLFVRPVFNKMGSPIWPEKFTKERLQEIAIHQGSYTFSTQYLLDPVPEDRMELKKQWLQMYTNLPRDINEQEVRLRNLIIVDPITAKKTTSTSKDRGVVLVVGIDKMRNWFLREYLLFERATESEMFDGIFKMASKYNTEEVGWESVAYQLQGKFNLEEKAQKLGIRLRVTELRPGHKDKLARIRALIPYFERGQIYIKPTMREFIYEYQRFPYGETIDILDALAYMVKMSDERKGGRNPFSKSTMAQENKPFYF